MPDIVNEDKTIDRRALGMKVFGNKVKREDMCMEKKKIVLTH